MSALTALEFVVVSREDVIQRYLRTIQTRHYATACKALTAILPEWQDWPYTVIAEFKTNCLRWHPGGLTDYFASECYQLDSDLDDLHRWNADKWWHAFEKFLDNWGDCS